MKIKAVFMSRPKSKSRRAFSKEKTNNYTLIFFLSAAVILGVIIFAVNKSSIVNEFSEPYVYFLDSLATKSKPDIFLGLIKNTLSYVLLVLLFSTSAIGDILIYLLSFIKLAGMSAFTAFLYSRFGIAGIKYCFAVYIPGKCLFTVATLILIDLCIKISKDYRQKNRMSKQETQQAGKKMILVVLFLIASVCVEFFCLCVFTPLIGVTSFV